MDNLKIGVIEDELIIADDIVTTLKQIGYRTTKPARNYHDALAMVKNESPDLLLVDIRLEGEEDGIDLAAKVAEDYKIPFIFLTANSDRATIDRAKLVRPAGFLVKPFNEQDLFSSIEIAFSNHNSDTRPEVEKKLSEAYLKEVIFIKEGHLFHKITISDIQYIESENMYLNIYTLRRKYVVRTKLNDFISNLGSPDFFRVHRSYLINIKYLETIKSLSLKVAGKDIPVNRQYKEELLRAINLM